VGGVEAGDTVVIGVEEGVVATVLRVGARVAETGIQGADLGEEVEWGEEDMAITGVGVVDTTTTGEAEAEAEGEIIMGAIIVVVAVTEEEAGG
jgi:hypothetical protein